MAVRATVDVEFAVRVTKPGPAAISVSAAHADTEELTVSWHGESEPVEFEHGTRAEVFDLPEGEHRITYHAERALTDPEPEPVTLKDVAVFTRPSRYCPSDRVGGLVPPEIVELEDRREQVEAIVRHVHARLSYVVGSSRPADDAIDTLLAGEGVCRDFAHVCITLCRFLDIPARYTGVYAPGLAPMDFHAVFEAAVDGHWYVFDATRLAPRQTPAADLHRAGRRRHGLPRHVRVRARLPGQHRLRHHRRRAAHRRRVRAGRSGLTRVLPARTRPRLGRQSS